MDLGDPITSAKGVGDEMAKKFAKLGVHTIRDFVEFYPRRYEDYSVVTPIARIRPGAVTIEAEFKQVTGRYVRRGMHITEAVASDATGSVRVVWFNQPYREAQIKRGQKYYVSGLFELSYKRLSIMNPSTELVSEFPVNTARIIPVYRETKGLTSKQIRRVAHALAPQMRALPEILPDWIIKDRALPSRADAVYALHFPKNSDDTDIARQRLGFDEVFALSCAGLLNKRMLAHQEALAIPFNVELAKQFVSHLPFRLTDDQRKAIWQIYQDIAKEQPMNRLVEGDVGSGKTVVAAMAALMAMEQGFQVALMAPTELLARQHAETIYSLLEPLGFAGQVGLLVGGLSQRQKAEMHTRITAGEVRFIVGTHALIQDKVDMHKLGLVIIDEQHRFGVEQRKKLLKKAGHAVHVLNLTATPIPRSLALTLYGELDISIIAAKPSNRKPIKTTICSPNSRAQLYKQIDAELAAGRQMFVVCPLIEDSDAVEARSAEKVYEILQKRDFKHRRVALLHGKMKPDEKNDIMAKFVGHEYDILVSTTVIEVGVDVPNATVMLIESAERFGLAQAHQLRGRVGRSEHQGYCYLMLSDSRPPSKRLQALESSNDGFKLAELDLKLRGPGAIYGTMQHGQLDLRIANLSDTKLIAAARQAAIKCVDRIDELVQYKELMQEIERLRAVTSLN